MECGCCVWLLSMATLLMALTVPVGEGYAQGAPDVACESMRPRHSNFEPSSDPSPFSIDVDKSEVEHGDKVQVQLKANDPDQSYFEGFFIQARANGSDQPLGSFFIKDESKYITCGRGFNNAVTHLDNVHKTVVVMDWQPTSDFTGRINFLTTFVKGYKKFWVKQLSIPVTIVEKQPPQEGSTPHSVPEPTPEPTPEPSPEPTKDPGHKNELPSSAFSESIYSGCMDAKGCFGFPEGCVQSKDCKSVVTYSQNGGKYDFEMDSVAMDNDYVAVGLSRDTEMGDDSVTECVLEEGEVKVYMSWNYDDHNIRLPADKAQEGLSNMNGQFSDGRLRCKFTRDAIFTFNSKQFNMNQEQFHLLVAAGAARPDRVAYHSTGRLVTGSPTYLSVYSKLAGKSSLFVTLHGSFMIGAWICAASCGIFLARYYKKTWVGSQLCSKDQWFAWHRFFMLLAWSLTIAGFVLMFIHLDGWTAIDYTENPHAILGVVTTALAFVQPFMAACRPHPNGKNRPLFNWMHWFVGNSAQIVGIVAIFFAVELPSVGLPRWMDWILAGFVGFHILFHIIMLIHTRWAEAKSNRAFNSFAMKEMGGHNPPLYPVEKNEDAPGTSCRRFMLAFYFIVNWLVTAALVLIVVFDPIEDQLREWKIIK